MPALGLYLRFVGPQPRSLEERLRWGFFSPESSVPGTEEIIAFVEENLVPERTQSVPWPQHSSPRPPGLQGRHTCCRSLVSAGTRALRKELACDLSVPWLPPKEASLGAGVRNMSLVPRGDNAFVPIEINKQSR